MLISLSIHLVLNFVWSITAKPTLANYSADEFPADRPVNVSIVVYFDYVQEVIGHQNMFVLKFFMHQTWFDERLKFETEDGNGTGSDFISMPRSRIWIPDTVEI